MKLEELINKHRDKFDDQEPPFLWQKIESNLKPAKTKNWSLYLGMAASLFLVLFVGIWIGKQQESYLAEKELPEAVQDNVLLVSSVKNVNIQKEEIKKLLGKQPSLVEDFTADINNLDEDYQYLRTQLENHPADERVIEAMLKNLDYQSKVLNKQSEILNETKNEKAIY
jgi:hypothetical protein